ncbi:head-tail connector protein [Pseudomonas syringae]|uniref:head-tail connector protein n=1 Tax=Pseudomonas syringae TaxID=317 RepID=UPI000646F514|nr:phage head-tail connector protein [Pseudomonas syringae]
MGLQILIEPTEQPVTLAQAKQHLRIGPDETDQDDEVNLRIRAASRRVGKITQRALTTQSWRLILDCFPKGAILIPLPPLQSVESVKYTDVFGVEQTLPESDYLVNPFGLIGRISMVAGKSWPATIAQEMALRIEFTAGYLVVPEDIVSAVLLLLGHLDQNREAVTTGAPSILPMGVDSLLSPYTIPSLP